MHIKLQYSNWDIKTPTNTSSLILQESPISLPSVAIGIVAAGRVHAGSIQPQMELSFAPSQRKCSVSNTSFQMTVLYYIGCKVNG